MIREAMTSCPRCRRVEKMVKQMMKSEDRMRGIFQEGSFGNGANRGATIAYGMVLAAFNHQTKPKRKEVKRGN